MKNNSLLSLLFLFTIICTTNFSCSKDNGGTTPTGSNVSISGFAFNSAALTVAKGATVKWTNNDATAHTVTSDTGTELNSGSIAPGATFSHTFSAAGSFSYHCNIHPSMTAAITVTP